MPKKKRQQQKKKGGGHRSGGGARQSGGGNRESSDEEDALAGCVDVKFVEEQRRLLEQFGAGGNGDEEEDAHAGCAGEKFEKFVKEQRELLEQFGAAADEGDAVERWTQASEAVIENQRRLLEEATSAKAASSGDAGSASARDEAFAVRRVQFFGRKVPVLLQNRNGPCALLAVANCLLLRGTLSLADGEKTVSSSQLVSRLAQLCEKLNAKAVREDANAREAVSQVIQRLPALMDGLLLNCRFGGCSDFESTAELGLFDLFGLDLYHAWVAPEVAEVARSWNDLAETLALYDELRAELETEAREPGEEEAEALARGLWLEQWFEETRTQVTPRGLQEVVDAVEDREVGVLFRNNHFSTIYKHRPEGLCSLLTDEAFADLESAVWESLEVDGSMGSILNASFEPAPPEELGGSAPGAGRATKADLLRTVQELGFSREQAKAGLAAVDWKSAEEAVEALLEADGELPQASSCTSPSSSFRVRRKEQGPIPPFEEEPVCPTCGKRMNTRAGLLSHRVSKGH